jgi:transposase-like protein
MLSMLEWLCAQLMEAEGSGLVGAEKNARNPFRSDYRCGYRPRRLDTRMGTMYLMIPKLRSRGYVPFFVTERKRSEAALIQVIQEAFVQGVSTRKMEKPARSLGIENLSRSQVSEMTKGLNEQVQEFAPVLSRVPATRCSGRTPCMKESVWMDAWSAWPS